MKGCVITGIGIVCNAGNNKEEFFSFLDCGQTQKNFKPPRIPLEIEIRVCEADETAFKPLSSDLFDNPTSRLCVKAARECIADFRKAGAHSMPDALIVGTSTGGQFVCEEFIFNYSGLGRSVQMNYPGQGMMSAVTRAVSNELELDCRVTTVSTACTSSANAIALGAKLIEQGEAEIVMAGGGDALCSTTLAGFYTLKLTGSEGARPFGQNRPGLTLGEGAAFLMLESKEKVLKENRSYYAEILSYAMGSDAYHMTAPSENGEGAQQVMNLALKKAGLKPQDISFINAHGTGTSINDRVEAAAIYTLFGETVPCSSIKGLTGHTLGGAGAIEAVASIYSILRRKAFENYNSYQPGEDCKIRLVSKSGLPLIQSPVVLSNSFAFGGNNCALIFGGDQR